MFVKISESAIINVMNIAWIDISAAGDGIREVHMMDGSTHAISEDHAEDITHKMKLCGMAIDRLALGNF